MSEATDKASIDMIIKTVLCGRCKSMIIVERTNSIFGCSAHCDDCILYNHFEIGIYWGGCKDILVHE